MRIRAARLSLAIAAAVSLAVIGVAGSAASGPLAGLDLMRPVIGTAVAPAHAAVAGLPGVFGHHVHQHVAAVDVLLAPATLLAVLLLVAAAVRRRERPVAHVPSAASARGPPARR